MATAESVADALHEGGDAAPPDEWLTDRRIRQSQLFTEWLNRLVTGRDMNIIITAASETGVGKTTLAVVLAILMDQHGWTADKASVANPIKYDRKYDEAKPGEVLILDEAEKAADARRGMKKEAVKLTQSFATKRYKQVFSILTAPSKSWVDKRLGGDAADYWIQCEQTRYGRIKGEASVYRLKENEHNGEDYAEFVEYLHWPSIDTLRPFEELDRRKVELLETDDDSQNWYHADEVESKISGRVEEAEQAQREQIICDLADTSPLTQSEIASVFGLHQSTISRIVNSDAA